MIITYIIFFKTIISNRKFYNILKKKNSDWKILKKDNNLFPKYLLFIAFFIINYFFIVSNLLRHCNETSIFIFPLHIQNICLKWKLNYWLFRWSLYMFSRKLKFLIISFLILLNHDIFFIHFTKLMMNILFYINFLHFLHSKNKLIDLLEHIYLFNCIFYDYYNELLKDI